MDESHAQKALRLRVRTELAVAGISQASASRQLGISTKHMNMMLTGKSTLSLAWAEQILSLCHKRLVLTTTPNDN